MWMYLSLKTVKIKDEELKEKLDDYYMSSSYLSPWDFDIRSFLQKSDNDEYLQFLHQNKLQEAIDEWGKTLIFFDKKFNNFIKIISCIVISSYSNKENQV